MRDEALRQKMSRGEFAHPEEAANDAFPMPQLPSAVPIQPRRRFIEPDIVVVNNAPGCKDDRERVDHQCGIEVLKIARADYDCRYEQCGPERGPGAGANAVGGTA